MILYDLEVMNNDVDALCIFCSSQIETTAKNINKKIIHEMKVH